MVDMYWKIYDQYVSAPSQASRAAMSTLGAKLDLLGAKPSSDASARYRRELHDSTDPAIGASFAKLSGDSAS